MTVIQKSTESIQVSLNLKNVLIITLIIHLEIQYNLIALI